MLCRRKGQVGMAMTDHEFVADSMIQGYHIFRTIWDAVIGESLQCVREVGNVEDRYAVAEGSDTPSNHVVTVFICDNYYVEILSYCSSSSCCDLFDIV